MLETRAKPAENASVEFSLPFLHHDHVDILAVGVTLLTLVEFVLDKHLLQLLGLKPVPPPEVSSQVAGQLQKSKNVLDFDRVSSCG